MQQEELKELVKNIQKQKTERQNVELKACEKGFPTRIYDTLSAFSNQDEGGVIIFGVAENPDYRVVGVYDVEQVQKRIMENCENLEPPVRALITIAEIDSKMVVAAEIPSVEYSRRPVYYKGAGIIKGSYIRIGDADKPMTDYEVYAYEAFRKHTRDEMRTVERVNNRLFDQRLLDEYLYRMKQDKPNLTQNIPDEELLELLGLYYEEKPTLACLLPFYRYPQAYFPQLSITAVSIAGLTMGDITDEGARFIDNKRITGTIGEMLKEAEAFVLKNCRIKTIIDAMGHREDRPEYPMKAVREAVLNALLHRDYSLYTENIPIRIEMYRDRLEIKNPGGLYGFTSMKELGSVRAETRNPLLAGIMEVLQLAENRYSGIPTIKKELAAYNLPEASFSSRHGEFKVVFYNNVYEPYPESVSNRVVRETEAADYGADAKASGKALKERILEFCALPRTRAELVDFTGMSRYYTMCKIIEPLVEQGLLQYTLPEKPKSSKQKFVAN